MCVCVCTQLLYITLIGSQLHPIIIVDQLDMLAIHVQAFLNELIVPECTGMQYTLARSLAPVYLSLARCPYSGRQGGGVSLKTGSTETVYISCRIDMHVYYYVCTCMCE